MRRKETIAYMQIVDKEKCESEATKLLEEGQKQKTAMELLELYLQFMKWIQFVLLKLGWKVFQVLTLEDAISEAEILLLLQVGNRVRETNDILGNLIHTGLIIKILVGI
ncbi:hypothetical protein C5167_006540 [Papaver somniferum]|uniref:Uncharacterized protein n=1 Tax=Papaver somniferum TaxID=3469 RepID=A0A4Y7JFD5_PAPSO|nr:hypothetical protein C5167_006540 [Papaver somniferum]